MTAQVEKYRFNKNSFNFVLNVTKGSFFKSLSRLFHNPKALYRKLLCPVVVEHNGICSASLFKLFELFKLFKLFVNISRLTITVTPPYINIADTITRVFELIFHSQKFTSRK